MVKPGKLEIDNVDVAFFKNVEPLTNKTPLRLLLGLCMFYRLFIEDFTGPAHSLNKLPNKGTSDIFTFDEEQRKFLNSVI